MKNEGLVPTGRATLWGVLLGWLALSAAMFGLFVLGALRERDVVIAKAEQLAQDRAGVAASHAKQIFESAHLALLGAERLIGRTPDWPKLQQSRRDWDLLKGLANALSVLPRLVIADSTGAIKLHTDVFPVPESSLADRPYFLNHKDGTLDSPTVTAPVIGKVSRAPVIPVSKRLSGEDGKFLGVAVANIEPKTFEDYFKLLGLGDGGHITLTRGDGLLLARHPYVEGAIGKIIDNAKAFPAIASGEMKGLARTVSPVDGRPRITAFERTATFGFIAIVGLSEDMVLEEWRHTSLRTGIVLGVALLLVSLMMASLTLRILREQVMQRDLMASKANLQRAQSVAHIGSWHFDISTKSLDWSDETYRIFASPPGIPLSNAVILDRVHPEDKEKLRLAWKNALFGQPYDLDFRIVTDGQTRWVHAQAEIMRNEKGQPVSVVGTVQDITQRKQDELSLEEKNRDLERSNAELEAFAYVSAHDLREPLRNINAFALLLERRLDARLEGEERDFFKIVRDGAIRMDHLISDLLEYSRIGHNPEEMGKIEMGGVVKDALANLASQVSDLKAEVMIPLDLPAVRGRRGELVRLMQNVIANALKYRLEGIAPRIELSFVLEGSVWRFSVKDNGIGIAPDQFDRIFRIFQRLHAREDYGGGTGIGLAVCKKIVERHGGGIWVTSEGEGKGATFSFTLPAFR